MALYPIEETIKRLQSYADDVAGERKAARQTAEGLATALTEIAANGVRHGGAWAKERAMRALREYCAAQIGMTASPESVAAARRLADEAEANGMRPLRVFDTANVKRPWETAPPGTVGPTWIVP